MAAVLAFDVYGTLIDTQGVVTRLSEYIGDQAEDFSRAWRDKQLEYSFRRGLMRSYATFAVCTSQALDYTDSYLGTGLSPDQKAALLAGYRSLPAFDDVQGALSQLRSDGHALYAFSNGTADAVETLLRTAGIRELFDGVVSVDDRQTFKPNPDVYAHCLSSTASSASDAWLVSSRRSGSPAWVISPTVSPAGRSLTTPRFIPRLTASQPWSTPLPARSRSRAWRTRAASARNGKPLCGNGFRLSTQAESRAVVSQVVGP